MISQTQNQREYLYSLIWNIGTKLIEVDKRYQNTQRLVKAKIQVTFTQKNLIIYLFDGVIFRQGLVKDICRNPEILTDMGQIQYFQWQGKYGQDQRKQGKWTATWDGQALIKVGGFRKTIGNTMGYIVSKNYSDYHKELMYEITLYSGGGLYNDQMGGDSIGGLNQMSNLGIIHKSFFMGNMSMVKKDAKQLFELMQKLKNQIYYGEWIVQRGSNKIGRWVELNDKRNLKPFIKVSIKMLKKLVNG